MSKQGFDLVCSLFGDFKIILIFIGQLFNLLRENLFWI